MPVNLFQNPPNVQTGGDTFNTPRNLFAPKAPQDLQTKLSSSPDYASQVGAEQVGGIKKIGSSIAAGAKSFQDAATAKNPISAVGDVLKGGAQSGFGTITGVAQTVLAPATPLISKITQAITPALRQQNPELANAYDSLVPKVQELSQKHPESSTLISDIVNTALLALGGGASENAVKESVGGALTKEGATGVKEGITKDVTTIAGKLKGEVAPKDSLTVAQDIVRKPQTAAYQKAASSESRFVEKGITGKRSILPDADEKAMAEATQPLVEAGELKKGMKPTEQQAVIDKAATSINNDVKKALEDPKNNKPFNEATLDKKFADLKGNRDIGLKAEPTANRAYDLVVEKFKSFLKSKDTKGLFNARQEFDAYMKKNYPNAFKQSATGTLSPTDTAINDAFYDVRNSVNDTIGEALPPYKAVMRRESGLIKASDTIGNRELVGTSGTGRLGRLIKAHPTAAKIVGGAALGAGGLKGVQSLGL